MNRAKEKFSCNYLKENSSLIVVFADAPFILTSSSVYMNFHLVDIQFLKNSGSDI